MEGLVYVCEEGDEVGLELFGFLGTLENAAELLQYSH